MSDPGTEVPSSPIDSEQARKAIAFLAANLEQGIEREIALDDVLAAVAMEGATEPIDLSVNIGKLLGGMALVNFALIHLRHKEQKVTPEKTVEWLQDLFGRE